MPYKHDYDKILTRLTIILSRMNDGEALSVTELAKEFNVSERTIQRDFNERLIHFPIYQEGKSWKMQKGFRLEKSASIEDAVVLDILEGLVDGSSGFFAKRAKRLLSKLKNEEYNPIYAKLDLEDISDRLHEIQQLESAIKSKKQISCHYIIESYTKKLDLKPLKIVNYQGFWYLIALDARNDLLKKYYLKNISEIKIHDAAFSTDAKLEDALENALSIWFEKDREPVTVKLRIGSAIAKYFKRKPLSKAQKIIDDQEDGTLIVTLPITHEMEIIPIVKYWMPHIRILEPEWIAERIDRDVREYQKREEK